jgi:transcription elongation factor SPT5
MGNQYGLRQRFPGMNDVMCDFFDGNYYSDGYLLKEVTIGTVVKPCTAEDPPTLDELQRFRRKSNAGDTAGYDDGDDEENEGSQLAGSILKELSELQGQTSLSSAGPNDRGLMIGDTIEVVEGDLVGMQGKILSLDGTTVKVRPNNDAALAELGGMDEVEFLISQVRKFIAVGAHVKVTDGRYANETGVVVAVEAVEGVDLSDFDCTAVVLTDMTHKEISVRTSQLQESAEIASGQDKLAGYELHDLVVLSGGGSANEVGVIVRVGREEFTVINNHGIAREARPEELRGKRNKASDRAVALDVQANQIRCGDSVTIVEGPHKGKVATIKRMSRAQLFLYSQFKSDHSGIFVVRSRSCVLTGGTKSRSAGGANPGASPMSTPGFNTPASDNGRGPMRGERDESLMGKTVRIQAGQWKGYLGTVSHTTATHVQVELHSRLKKVMVVKERVHVIGDKFGATENDDGANKSNPNTTPFMGAMTPMYGSATPLHGGATPMHGGATPSYEGYGGSTPSHAGVSDDIWRPGGSLDREEEEGWGAINDNALLAHDGINGDSGSSGWGASSDLNATWTPDVSETESAIKQDPTSFNAMSDSGGVDTTIEGTGEEAAVWFMERVCVQLKSNNAKAVIKEINGSSALVELEDGSNSTIRNGEVTMVPPQEHDLVLVTGGADVGVEGELVCIDGTDAILKESNENFKIVDYVHLAKIAN